MRIIITVIFPVIFLLISCGKIELEDEPDGLYEISDLIIQSYETGVEGICDLFFISESTGYLVGSDGMIMKSINSGKEWIPLKSGTEIVLNCVYFLNESVGFATGRYQKYIGASILSTNDGGKNWTSTFYSGIDAFIDIYFKDEHEGIAAIKNLSGELYIAITNDGGQSWRRTDLPLLQKGMIHSINNTCYIESGDSLFFKTYNMGVSWDSIYTPVEYTNACFVTSEVGYISKDEVIYYTEDGGESWSFLAEMKNYIYSFHFFDTNKGFCISYRIESSGEDTGYGNEQVVASIISVTNDGGQTWTTEYIPEYIEKNYFSFPSSNKGYNIYRTGIFIFNMH